MYIFICMYVYSLTTTRHKKIHASRKYMLIHCFHSFQFCCVQFGERSLCIGMIFGIFLILFLGTLHVGDEIREINGVTVVNQSVDSLQKMLVSSQPITDELANHRHWFDILFFHFPLHSTFYSFKILEKKVKRKKKI